MALTACLRPGAVGVRVGSTGLACLRSRCRRNISSGTISSRHLWQNSNIREPIRYPDMPLLMPLLCCSTAQILSPAHRCRNSRLGRSNSAVRGLRVGMLQRRGKTNTRLRLRSFLSKSKSIVRTLSTQTCALVQRRFDRLNHQ